MCCCHYFWKYEIKSSFYDMRFSCFFSDSEAVGFGEEAARKRERKAREREEEAR